MLDSDLQDRIMMTAENGEMLYFQTKINGAWTALMGSRATGMILEKSSSGFRRVDLGVDQLWLGLEFLIRER